MSEDDSEADIESNEELDNSIHVLESPEQQDVSAAPNVPRLIQPSKRSQKTAEKRIVTVSARETKRNKGTKKKFYIMGRNAFTWINMLLDQKFRFNEYCRIIVSTCQ